MILGRYHSTPSWGARLPSVLMPREAATQNSTTNTSAEHDSLDITNSFKTWIIIAAITALLTFSACVILVALTISKRQLVKQQLEEARARNPFLEEKPFSRRRRMAAEDRALDAESTREHMIRKSLASRSGRSDRSGSTASSTSRPGTGTGTGTGSGEGLKCDWKEFESRMSRQSSMTSLRRTRSPLPDLPDVPAPALSRSRSESLGRNPLLAGRTHSELPPLLEQHPCLRKPN